VCADDRAERANFVEEEAAFKLKAQETPKTGDAQPSVCGRSSHRMKHLTQILVYRRVRTNDIDGSHPTWKANL